MDKFIEKNRKKILQFVALLGIGVFTYSELMTEQLVNNYDGIWEGNFHNAGAWEMSLGRWFWCYLSRLRFGIANDPVTSIITLILFVAGILLIADLMEVKDSLVVLAAGGVFLCTPLVCIDLSYRYMSPTFGTSFLLAVLAVYLAVRTKKTWLAVLLGSISMALSVGSYQAYIGVACVLTLAWFIRLLMSGEKLPESFKKLTRPVLAILIGGVFYIIGLKLHLMVTHIEMSDYMGASDYSLMSVLTGIPKAFINTYVLFWNSFTGNYFHYSKLTGFGYEYVVAIAVCAALVFYCFKNSAKDVAKIILTLAAVLLMPPAAFAVFFITTGVPLSIQMTAGFFMILPAIIMALPLSFEKKGKEKVMAMALSVIVLISAYGGFYQVQTDESAMHEGILSTVSIADAALNRADELGYLSTENKYCFIGNPAASELYHLDNAADDANSYAAFGNFWSGFNSEKSWQGVVNDRMGLDLEFAGYSEYYAVAGSEEVEDMPAFPAEGSVILKDGVVVIKISD